MTKPISTKQLRNNSDISLSSSELFIYSSSNVYSSPRSSVESAQQSEPLDNLTELNIVTPTNSQHPRACNNINETKSVQRLQAEVHNLQEQSSRQSHEYERAIRRTLIENEYVRKINAKLVAKLESLTCEDENMKSSLRRLESVAQRSKDTMIELGDGQRSTEEEMIKVEGRNRKLRRELEVRADTSRKQQMETDAILSANKEKDAKLNELEQRDRAMEELVMELRDSLQISSQSYNKLRIELNTALGERENARVRVEELLMERDDEVFRRINAETALAKVKRELNDLRQRLDTFTVVQQDVSLRGETGRNGMDTGLGKEKEELQGHAESKVEARVDEQSASKNALTAMEVPASECATEGKGLQKENLRSRLEATTTESAECESNMNVITTGMEKKPYGDTLDAEVKAIQCASKIADITAKNSGHFEQVATLKDALQEFAKISRESITADRDMLMIKSWDIPKENDSSDFLISTLTNQMGTLNEHLKNLSTRNDETQLEWLTTQTEVSALMNELVVTKELLNKANAAVTFLRCQLTSTDEALDSMTWKFKSATDELDKLKGCIDDFTGILKPVEHESAEKNGSCHVAADPKQISLDNTVAKESSSNSTEQERNRNDHISLLATMKSVFQSLQLQNCHLRTSLAGTENEMDQKCNELSKLELENKGLIQSNEQLKKEIKEISAKCHIFHQQLDHASDEAKGKISSLNSKLIQQLKDYEELGDVVSSLEREKKDALGLISHLRLQLMRANESACLQRTELQERVQQLERDRKLLIAQNEELTAQISTTMDKIASLEQMSIEDKKSREIMQHQLKNLKVLMDESSALASERSKELALSQKQNAKFEEELKERLLEEKELYRTLELVKRERNDYKLTLSSVSDQVKLQKSDIDCMHKEATQLNDEIALLRIKKNEAEALIKKYECSVRSLCTTRGLLQMSGHSFDEMLMMLESENSKQLERTNSMEIALVSLQDENDILEQQVHILSKDVSKCNRENRKLLTTIAKLSNFENAGIFHSGSAVVPPQQNCHQPDS